ncbi:ankyrin repeat-containing protein NPR4-like [Phragmites australis]|uniref:ankyrin repeat-containing protein NPR4-like n=1 Tax=Phragmites australis TaxID=29695 RepID=UPI002D791609|nr:ankyrin repeat-containing protein NPR4-like [Phragmites australis]
MATGTASASSSGWAGPMEKRLLKAAIVGDARSMRDMAAQNPGILHGTTPQGNTCLHISSIHGHEGFCKEVLPLERQPLLAVANSHGETPLLTAVTCGHASLASVLLGYCRAKGFSEAILRQDNNGCNALHHAIRSGHKDLALELAAKEPALSRAVNKYNESPMFIAVMRDFTDIFEKLLEIPDSSHVGTYGHNALHAAVRNGNAGIAKRIVEARPCLATEQTKDGKTPIQLTVLWDMIDVLRVLLEHDVSLGYQASNSVVAPLSPLLVAAAYRGHVDVAQELLNHCPDAPYCDENGWTCLHQAVDEGQTEFVEFILRTPQLRKLVNMRDKNGQTALHHAVRKCNPKIVASLLFHKDIDFTVYDHKGGQSVIWQLWKASDHAKTLNWNEVSRLMMKADPKAATTLHQVTKKRVTYESTKDVKSLTQTYTSNTSLVAMLIATITFAAAFTLPGGYSNDAGSEGLPVMAKKLAFQAFLISDTLAMCSSLAVAFICILTRWEDLEFLLYYRSFTKKLMWFAYISTIVAFATGLYTVLAPRVQSMAIGICSLLVLMPILTKLLGEWPAYLEAQISVGSNF